MQIRTDALVNAWGSFSRCAADRFLSYDLQYRIKPMHKAAVEIMKDYNEIQSAAIEEFGGKPNDAGGIVFPTPAKRKEFQESLKKVKKQNVIIPGKPFEMEAFKPRYDLIQKVAETNPDKLPEVGFLSADDLVALDWLIRSPAPEAEELIPDEEEVEIEAVAEPEAPAESEAESEPGYITRRREESDLTEEVESAIDRIRFPEDEPSAPAET